MLPRFAVFQQAHNAAGLQAPVIGEMLEARLLSIWLKLLSENHFWARLERKKISDVLELKRNITAYTALNTEVIRTKAWPKEWKPYLLAWKKAQGKINISHNWP